MNNKRKAPELQVGIFTFEKISFTLNSSFIAGNEGVLMEGRWEAISAGRKIILQDDQCGDQQQSHGYNDLQKRKKKSFHKLNFLQI